MKKTINHLLACYLLITASCSKQIDKPVVTAVEESPLAASHFIGEHFGGGIIFYINSDGKHGIIAAEEDIEEPSVWAYTDTVTGAIASKPGGGLKNTQRIFHVLGDPIGAPEDYAALECREFSLNGFTDWFMPSKDELNEMYKQKEMIGGFKPFAYWSSTEVSASRAWFQNFGAGQQVKTQKIYSYSIRPVRYF